VDPTSGGLAAKTGGAKSGGGGGSKKCSKGGGFEEGKRELQNGISFSFVSGPLEISMWERA